MIGRRSFPFGARPIFRGELLVSGRVSTYLVREVEVETRPSEIYWFILKYQNLLDCEILQLIPNEELIDKLILSGYCSNIINISLDGDCHTKFLSPPPFGEVWLPWLPSLELSNRPSKYTFCPKKERIFFQTINFQGQTISFREGIYIH